eukprot:3932991-Rhodomonas_salina.1
MTVRFSLRSLSDSSFPPPFLLLLSSSSSFPRLPRLPRPPPPPTPPPPPPPAQVVADASVTDGYTTCMLHPDGLILGTATEQQFVRVWDVKTQQVPPRSDHDYGDDGDGDGGGDDDGSDDD